MKAEEASLKDVLENEPRCKKVPFFQRKYVWVEENWEELLSTLENFHKEKVFWGSIIIKWTDEMDDGNNYRKGYIIDGQQRLTTIAILTKCIYDSLEDTNKKRAIEKVKNDIFFPPRASSCFEDGEYDLIIEHSRVDKDDFETIMNAGLNGRPALDITYNEENVNKESQIRRCYAYYMQQLKEKETRELLCLLDNLYGSEKVFVKITLAENDVNEQTIFDSINRAGMKLYTSDIIKNNLFKKLANLSDSNVEVNNICNQYWDDIFWGDTELWDEKRRFGNVSKSHLDFLLYCVACIEWPEDDFKDLNEKLEMVYEKGTQDYTKIQLIDLIHKIAEMAFIYKKYIFDFSKELESISFCKEDNVNRLLLIADKFKIQMFYPYILKRLHENADVSIENKSVECRIDNKELKKDMKALETYIMRRRICSASTSSYSKKCLDILKNGIKALYIEYSQQDIEEEDKNIKNAIENMKNSEVAKMVLFCIELTKWDEMDDINAITYNFQLEHIMPQKYQQYWATPSNLSEDEWGAQVTRMGNMLLLKQALNNRIKNREFSVKVNGYEVKGKKIEGYKDKTQLKLTKEIVDEYSLGKTIWDDKRISERTEKIWNEIIDNWNIKKVLEN